MAESDTTAKYIRTLKLRVKDKHAPELNRQVKAIHAKVRDRRKDETHKFTTKLVQENGAIFVGNISSKAMVKTNMAKSALDAGWSSLKTMLESKCECAGVIYKEVNEAHSTRVCSECGALSGPKGLKELGISGPRRGNGPASSVEARTSATLTPPRMLPLWESEPCRKSLQMKKGNPLPSGRGEFKLSKPGLMQVLVTSDYYRKDLITARIRASAGFAP